MGVPDYFIINLSGGQNLKNRHSALLRISKFSFFFFQVLDLVGKKIHNKNLLLLQKKNRFLLRRAGRHRQPRQLRRGLGDAIEAPVARRP